MVLVSNAQALEIPMTIEELLPESAPGFVRSNAPLRFGVPLPASAAVDAATLFLIDGLGPLQVRPLASHPDGSWKWMLVETRTDLGAGEKRPTTLRVGIGAPASGSPLASRMNGNVAVNTGAALFLLRENHWNGIDQAIVGGTTRIHSGHDGGFVVMDSSGTLYRSALDAESSIAFESNGPVSATLVVRGHLVSEQGEAFMSYSARLRFTLGRSDLELELTLQNAERSRLQTAYVRWAAFQLPFFHAPAPALPLIVGVNDSTRSFTAGGDPARTHTFYQGRTTFRRDKGTAYVEAQTTQDVGVLAMVEDGSGLDTLWVPGVAEDHLDGWIALGGTDESQPADLTLAVRDLAPLFPTGFRLLGGNDSVSVLSYDILSPANSRAEPLVWSWGAHHTGVAVLGFDTAPRDAWAQVQFPLFARCDFEYLREVGAIYGERRLVDLQTEQDWFMQQGKSYTTDPPSYRQLDVIRYWDFGQTGGANQFDKNMTFLLDYLRAGQTARMLQVTQDAAWKSDQAVVHSDDFDYGTLALGETDLEVDDPKGWNGRGRNTQFDNEHPHWLTLPPLYYLTGNERLREGVVDYCEWRRYRAGNHQYGPIYGKGLTHMRLWSRAWRDIALAWEFTGEQRYYDDLLRMTERIVYSNEVPGEHGRSFERGHFYWGSWTTSGRPIQLFFLIDVHADAAYHVDRVLPEGALREDLRDYRTGLAYFTLESRVTPEASGFPYVYYLEAENTPNNRGDQIGYSMAHGYEWTGNAIFADYARDLAWRVIVDAKWERGSELATLVRIHTDLNRDRQSVGWIENLEIAGGEGVYTLDWVAPAGATSYIVKHSTQPMVENLWFDGSRRVFRHDPAQYTSFWAATNVSDEPQPGPAGAQESLTISGLDPAVSHHFAIQYLSTAPVAGPLDDVIDLRAVDDESGRIRLDWGLPISATGARVVLNDSLYSGFAAHPGDGFVLSDEATTTFLHGASMRDLVRGRTYFYTVFARDTSGEYASGAHVSLTYDPPPLPPIVTVSALPTRGEGTLEVAFQAKVNDPEGALAAVQWDFGDGSEPSTNLVTSHLYTRAGDFEARLTAVDSSGLSVTRSIPIQVSAFEAPRVSLSAFPLRGQAPLTVSVEAKASDASAIAESFWYAGDDTVQLSKAAFTFASPGTWTATFRALDEHGLQTEQSINFEVLPLDLESPVIVTRDPAPGSTDIPVDATISVTVADPGSGLQLDSAVMALNGVAMDPVVKGDESAALLFVTPPAALPAASSIEVHLVIEDRAPTPNVLNATWSFTTQTSMAASAPDSLEGTARINFQLRESAPPSGYKADSGDLYDPKRHYGWLFDRPEVRGSAGQSRPALDELGSLPAMASTDGKKRQGRAPVGEPVGDRRLMEAVWVSNVSTATWCYDLAPGVYQISLAVGSPVKPGLHRVRVGSQLVVADVPTAVGEFHTIAGAIQALEEGPLQIQIGGSPALSTALCYVEIKAARRPGGANEDTQEVQPGDGQRVDPLEQIEPAQLEFLGTRGPVHRFRVVSPQASSVRLNIYDVRGRRLNTLYDGTIPAGTTLIEWDGVTRTGVQAANGVYWVMARLDTVLLRRKLLLLR